MRIPLVPPFRIEIPEEDIADLHARLDRTRWPGEVAGSGWVYGTNLEYLRELCAYWRGGYDWRAHESELNRFAQYREPVEGLDVHFIHERGVGPRPFPLILTHGWPSSFYEWHKVIRPLADPEAFGGDAEDAFDVVVPSPPGYGFSEIPTEAGVSPRRMARMWAALMSSLGYERFGAHGGDWGSFVSALLAFDHPHRVAGLHLTMVPMAPPHDPVSMATPGHEDRRRRAEEWRAREAGYQAIQASKPQTLAYGLTDSPAGLAGWIIEKFRAWSDCHGDVETRFTHDELLTNVSIYWFTGTISSSTRLYFENRVHHFRLQPGERVEVPTGFAMFPAQGIPPRERAERAFNVSAWQVMPSGGHFPAMEEPDLLVDDIRAFYRPLRG